MSKLILTLFSMFIGCLLFGQQASSQSTAQKIDEYIASANTAGKFNGTVLVAQNGAVLLNKGYGFKSNEINVLNDSNTIFQIGSITKSFTAVALLKLQEEGMLSIHDLLSKYFPDYPNGNKITLQHLLTHTSGIYNYTDDIGEEDTAVVCHPVPKAKVMAVFKNKPLAFKHGKQFAYCNSGYYLLGMIIEKVTGKPYESIVREVIFNPLQMDHSGFDFINLKDTNKAQGYIFLTQNNVKPNYTVDSTIYYSVGGMYSTTNDLYKWSQAIATNSLLTQQSWMDAFTPFKENYGFGFFIDTLFGRTYVRHTGGLLGFTSDFLYYTKEDLTIILLNNVGNYGNSLQPILMGISSIVFQLPYSKWQVSKQDIALADSILQKYVGVYTPGGKTKITVTIENGQLYAAGNTKQSIPKLPIYPISETTFVLKDFNATIEFVKDNNGEVRKIISHENGKEIELKRL